MAEIAIVYGSTTGNTLDACKRLANWLGDVDVLNVADIAATDLAPYSKLILATSTWGMGDMQDDWEDFFPSLDEVDFTGKSVALMGLGDQQNYPDLFVDCLAQMHDKVIERGGTVVGYTDTASYEYEASEAERDGKFLGLIIDEDSQGDKTDGRLKKWSNELKNHWA